MRRNDLLLCKGPERGIGHSGDRHPHRGRCCVRGDYSSTGILNAVKQALAKAANPEGTASQPEETETPADGEEAAASEPQVMEPVVEVVQPEEKQPSVSQWVTELWQSIFAQEEQPASSEEVPASREAAEEPASSAQSRKDLPTAGEHYGGTGGSRRMKRYRNFILRAVNLLLVAVLLVQYQHIAVARAARWPSGNSRSRK